MVGARCLAVRPPSTRNIPAMPGAQPQAGTRHGRTQALPDTHTHPQLPPNSNTRGPATCPVAGREGFAVGRRTGETEREKSGRCAMLDPRRRETARHGVVGQRRSRLGGMVSTRATAAHPARGHAYCPKMAALALSRTSPPNSLMLASLTGLAWRVAPKAVASRSSTPLE